jgi:spore maturation protein SpmB
MTEPHTPEDPTVTAESRSSTNVPLLLACAALIVAAAGLVLEAIQVGAIDSTSSTTASVIVFSTAALLKTFGAVLLLAAAVGAAVRWAVDG